jgi:hypothetical protein
MFECGAFTTDYLLKSISKSFGWTFEFDFKFSHLALFNFDVHDN